MQRFAPAFEHFVAPARRQAELWRTALGLCLIALLYLGFGYGFVLAADRIWGMLDISGQSPRSMVVLLATFIGMALAPIIVAPVLHRRGWATLFGRAAWVLRDFCFAVLVAGAVFMVSLGLWFLQYDALPGLDLSVWLAFLPLALMGLLIQTGAEELVFRGYLQQQLAARFATPLVWALVPSLLFGYAHFAPAEAGPNAWAIVGATAVFGLLAADLTARTGSIGAAWGLHFTNNLFAIAILSLQGPLSGLALLKTPYGLDAPILPLLLLADAMTLILAWAILRRILSR